MKNISAYKIVERCTLEMLEKAVNDLISEGWQPYGNLIVVSSGISTYDNTSITLTSTTSNGYRTPTHKYTQAMVKGESITLDENALIEFMENYGKQS